MVKILVFECLYMLMFICHYAFTDCRMRGHCTEINGHRKPCPYNGPALPILDGLNETAKENALDLLKKRCPHIVYDKDGNLKPEEEMLTCCQADTLSYIMKPISMYADGILGSCKTCLHNYVRQICEMHCSSDQARFLDVRTEEIDGVTYVNEINYRVHGDFMSNTFDSCAAIQLGDISAVKLMCQVEPICDADGWFRNSGNTANTITPVTVNFIRSNNTIDSMNAKAVPCNESLNGDLPCGCVNCMASCPVSDEPKANVVCSFYNINCLYSLFIGIFTFVFFIVVLTPLVIFDYRNRLKANNCSANNKYNNSVNTFFQNIFSRIGLFSMTHPIFVLLLTAILVCCLTYSVINIKLTTDPIELWSLPDSRSRKEFDYFNEKFEPFYRTAQIFVKVKKDHFEFGGIKYGPAFRFEAIMELIKIENMIFNIGMFDKNVTLDEICLAPLKKNNEKNIDLCVYMSASVYLNSVDNIENGTYLYYIKDCLKNHYNLDCLASWGGGSIPELTFGGYMKDIYNANTLILTIPIKNSLEKANLKPILEWETHFLTTLQNYERESRPDFIEITFSAGRSIEDEIERTSRAEIRPMAISYILVFIYVITSLGHKRCLKTWFIETKIFVGVASIFIVVLAICAALGIMSYSGVPTTLIAINIIPFLLLSVGIDNIYLIVHILQYTQENIIIYDDFREDFDYNERKYFIFKKMLNRVCPSMFLSSTTQMLAFFIGTLSKFPAVKTFAIFSSFSLLFLFIFQITTMIAVLSLDYNAVFNKKWCFFFCAKHKHKNIVLKDEWIKNFMKSYSQLLLKRRVKVFCSIIFILVTCLSIVSIPYIAIGLDEELAFPKDSYVSKYLKSVKEDLHIGPPVYFVVKSGLNYSDNKHQRVLCGGSSCESDSMVTQIILASQYSNITYISNTLNFWLDDYFDWTHNDHCCKYTIKDNSFCSSYELSAKCKHCDLKFDRKSGLPTKKTFEKYIPFFLQDEPTDVCVKGGLAMHSTSVKYILDEHNDSHILDSNFMAYHVPLSTSKDFINALRYAYELSENITQAIQKKTSTNVEVFPYSVFYIYYEQYLTMWDDTLKSLLYCFVCAFAVNLLVSGITVVTTSAVMLCCTMLVLNMMGLMYLWNISLNPISCVNLIISIGMTVEFCSHIANEFNIQSGSANIRVREAIALVGSTILTGLFFVNFPIILLAFSHTGFIRVFFFKMFFSATILGLLYSMIFMPLLFSYIGDISRL